jgi:hypothetical protein
VRIVHVINTAVRGEVRGYVLVVEDATLHLRTPCSTGEWTEIDDAIAKRLDASVVPYVVSAGGFVIERPEVPRG